MSTIEVARGALRSALEEYARADTEAKQAQVLLSLHGGLDLAMRAHVESQSVFNVDPAAVSYPKLVDLVRDYTTLFEGDGELPRLLVSLNNTRRRIAHPELGRPSAGEISRDAGQYMRMARRFWPRIFREAFPEALLAMPAVQKPASAGVPSPRPAPAARPVAEPRVAWWRSPRWDSAKRFLRRLWRDETSRPLEKRLLLRRLIGVSVFFVASHVCKEAAIFTARWPEPIKYAGVALFVVGVALFVWGLVLAWRVLRQVRLKRVVVFLAVTYLVLLGVVVLTSAGSSPWYQVAWQTTRDWVRSGAGSLADGVEGVVRAPGEFAAAYRGFRRPVQLPGMDREDPAYLTPIPANRPVRVGARAEPTTGADRATATAGVRTPVPGQAAGESFPEPDCPHAQARLTAPGVGQAVEGQVRVMGTASIEDFDYYKFEYRREDGDLGDEWHWVASYESRVEEGVLGTWDVSRLATGAYTLRLTVVDRSGNYPFPPCDVAVRVVGD